MVSKRRLLVLALVAFVFLLPLTGLVLLLVPPPFLYDHTHHYGYSATVTTTGALEDATLYLPVPARGGEASLSVEDLWLSDENGTHLSGVEPSVVETASGPMLRLQADRLPGRMRYTLYTYAPNGSLVDRAVVSPAEIPANMTNRQLEPNPTTYHVNAYVVTDERIDTRHPVGNASFLSPVYNVTRTECAYAWTDEDVCSTFDSRVYAEYETSPGANVTVGVGGVAFDAWNEWGFALTNGFNAFEAQTGEVAYADGRQGWTTLAGRLHAGMGRYDEPPE